MSDEDDPSRPADDPLRLLRELLDRIADASRAALTASARTTPSVVSGPLAAYVEGVTHLTERLTGPLEQLLEEQQVMAEQLADWAQQHRRLSEEIASWAERHRQMTEQLQRVVRPSLEQVTRMSEVAKDYVDELRR